MKKINKFILGLTGVAAVATPVVAVVSCGSSASKSGIRHFNLLPTYTGQADQLIALGVGADYYPLQLDATKPYEYLINPGQYMVEQTDDFKAKFAKRIAQLMPATKGTSWWNQTALSREEKGSDPAYWQQQEGGVLLYEHYLLDDDIKIIDKSTAPKHVDVSTVQTNFRWSRDPFTRIPKAVFYGWDLTDAEINTIISTNAPKTVSIEGPKKADGSHETLTASVDKHAAEIIKALKAKGKEVTASSRENDWLYNDYFFVNTFHEMFLDNPDFKDSNFYKWLVDTTTTSPFDGDKETADKLKALFDASTFQKEEVAKGIGPSSTVTAPATHHHPIYDQQSGEIGAAPMFEGSMRDNQLYLFNVAWQLSNLVNFGTPYGKDAYDKLPAKIVRDDSNSFIEMALSKEEADKAKAYVASQLTPTQVLEISKAFENANKIAGDLSARMAALKTYFEALKQDAGQTSPLTFGMVTIAPGGGMSTVQTMSKYSFLYKELGFNQPIPKSIDSLVAGAQAFTSAWTAAGANPNLNADGKVATSNDAINKALGADSIFNMDDNGWFWNLGEKGKLDNNKLIEFEGQFDLGVVAAREVNWAADVAGDNTHLANMNKMFKGGTTNNNIAQNHRVNYDLWNEGLKTPFVMHMLLDQIQKQMEDWYLAKGKTAANLQAIKASHPAATSWGTYFATDYIRGL